MSIRRDEIARRAYQLYEQRGREHGRDWDDWFQAERETLAVEMRDEPTAAVAVPPKPRRRQAERKAGTRTTAA